jgi:hypothetical protein
VCVCVCARLRARVGGWVCGRVCVCVEAEGSKGGVPPDRHANATSSPSRKAHPGACRAHQRVPSARQIRAPPAAPCCAQMPAPAQCRARTPRTPHVRSWAAACPAGSAPSVVRRVEANRPATVHCGRVKGFVLAGGPQWLEGCWATRTRTTKFDREGVRARFSARADVRACACVRCVRARVCVYGVCVCVCACVSERWQWTIPRRVHAINTRTPTLCHAARGTIASTPE